MRALYPRLPAGLEDNPQLHTEDITDTHGISVALLETTVEKRMIFKSNPFSVLFKNMYI